MHAGRFHIFVELADLSLRVTSISWYSVQSFPLYNNVLLLNLLKTIFNYKNYRNFFLSPFVLNLTKTILAGRSLKKSIYIKNLTFSSIFLSFILEIFILLVWYMVDKCHFRYMCCVLNMFILLV